MTIDRLKAIASDPCINLSGLVSDAGVSRDTVENYIKGRRGKYGIKKEVSEKLDSAVERLIERLKEATKAEIEFCEFCGDTKDDLPCFCEGYEKQLAH